MCQWPSLRGPHWLLFPGAGIAGQSISCEEDFVTEWMAQQLAVHQQYLVRAEQCGCELNLMDPRLRDWMPKARGLYCTLAYELADQLQHSFAPASSGCDPVSGAVAEPCDKRELPPTFRETGVSDGGASGPDAVGSAKLITGCCTSSRHLRPALYNIVHSLHRRRTRTVSFCTDVAASPPARPRSASHTFARSECAQAAACPAKACLTNPSAHPLAGEHWPASSGFSELRMCLAARVNVEPEEFDRPELRGQPVAAFKWITSCRASGAVLDASHRDRYALMMTQDHLRLRPLPLGWSLDEVIADVLSLNPRVLGVRVLRARLLMRCLPYRSWRIPGTTLRVVRFCPLTSAPLRGAFAPCQFPAVLLQQV